MTYEFLDVSQGELILRRILWLHHGCSSEFLYGDDGELQCSHPRHRTLSPFYLMEIEHTTGLILDIVELKGKDLVCWCAPLPYHADVLLKLASR